MKRILIVEDNEKNMKLFRVLLNSQGYEVLEAENGKEGIKKAKDNIPNLIIMDIQMPEMDGIEAMKRIKHEPSIMNIPVIAITSYAMNDDRERILKEGFDSYISKPINTKEVLEIIRNFLP